MSTLRLHCNAVAGSTERKTHYNRMRYIYATVVQIFNTTSFTGFHVRKQMPHPPSFDLTK